MGKFDTSYTGNHLSIGLLGYMARLEGYASWKDAEWMSHGVRGPSIFGPPVASMAPTTELHPKVDYSPGMRMHVGSVW